MVSGLLPEPGSNEARASPSTYGIIPALRVLVSLSVEEFPVRLIIFRGEEQGRVSIRHLVLELKS